MMVATEASSKYLSDECILCVFFVEDTGLGVKEIQRWTERYSDFIT